MKKLLLLIALLPLVTFADIQYSDTSYKAFCGRTACGTFDNQADCDSFIAEQETATPARTHKCRVERYAEYFEPEPVPEPEPEPMPEPVPVPPLPSGNEPGATITTHNETIPNPCFGSSLRTSGGYTNWAAGDCVIVDSFVMLSGAQSVGSLVVYPGGQLLCAPSGISLTVTTILVTEGGSFGCGTASNPAQAEFVFRDAPFANDSSQILHGLISVNGTVELSGVPRKAFYRMKAALSAGATQINLENVAGWQVGDKVLVPKSTVCRVSDNNQDCDNQTEERTIFAIAGNTITLNAPLSFNHPGVDGNLPHVFNAQRSIVFRSENPTGVRGHTLFHGSGITDIENVAFLSMGRTNTNILGSGNQKGRYPLHAHHLSNGFTFSGNVIDFGQENSAQHRKWGLTVHHSPNGLIDGNLIYRAYGAGLSQEDDTRGNTYTNNAVVYVIGGNGERLEDPDPGDGSKLGRAGVAYWFNAGQGNTYGGNIAAHVAECDYCYGFKFDNVHGSDYSDGLTFSDNEAYAVPNGLTIWWMCIEYETVHNGNCSSLIDNFRVWNHHRWGYFGYETYQLTIRNFHARVDPSYLQNPYNYINAMWFADYQQQKLVIEDIDAPTLPMDLPSNRGRGCSGPDCGETVVCGGSIKRINVPVPASTSSSGSVSDANTYLRGVNYQSLDPNQVCWDCGEPQYGKLNALHETQVKDCAVP